MRALITGITGQDGSYLAELLLAKGYEVHGLTRRASGSNLERIAHLLDPADERSERLHLHHGDLSDAGSLRRVLDETRPDEVYNLAAQSHVHVSFEQPEYTADVVALGTLRMLEATRGLEQASGRRVRFFQAGSSEMFGSTPPPQDEATPFHPRSPYGASKAAAHHYAVNFREAHGMFVATGILFNHESPRRGESFVTRKVTRAVGRIREGLQSELVLGNLDARRDWGFAGDYVEAMWRMLRADRPDSWVVATGVSHSVRDLVETAFAHAGLDWRDHVRTDPRFLRPAEVDDIRGDSTRIRAELGWRPQVDFAGLIGAMVEGDLELARRERERGPLPASGSAG
jgi:GDPmannose 4,6-dehydratase